MGVIRSFPFRGAVVPLLAVLLLGLEPATPLSGQLISPGRLSAPHEALEGIRNCTACHRLRQKGVDRERCLGCHTPLARRVEEGRGFHATLPERDCAACHKDHFGRDFDVLRFDTLAFEHERGGYALTGAHRETGCRDCHVPALVEDAEVRAFKARNGSLERTFLGLGTSCVGCHAPADPHRDQFADRSCESCHSTEGWEELPGFDHQETRYPLTGAHRQVDCRGCHAPLPPGVAGDSGTGMTPTGDGALRFRPLSFGACTSCHQDPHGGTMQGTCTTCHGTAAWRSVDRGRLERTFDHGSTGFELEGSHARLACASCHDPGVAASLEGITLHLQPGADGRAYPPPRADTCTSCHDDAHRGELADRPEGSACQDCHGQTTWLPARFDLGRHDASSSFPLEGAHRVTPCAGCHRTASGELRLRLTETDCVDCHALDDPHRDQFAGRECRECHDVTAFAIPAFDHDRTPYRLEGAHREVTCQACHVREEAGPGISFVRYRPLGSECTDCHGGSR